MCCDGVLILSADQKKLCSCPSVRLVSLTPFSLASLSQAYIEILCIAKCLNVTQQMFIMCTKFVIFPFFVRS